MRSLIILIYLLLIGSCAHLLAGPAAKSGVVNESRAFKEAELRLSPGDYVFIGYDNGIYSKSQYSMGVVPIGRFQVSPALTNQVVRLSVKIQAGDEREFQSATKVLLGTGDGTREALGFVQPIPLERKMGELSSRPIPKDMGAQPFEPLLLPTLQVHRIPYLVYRGEDHAIIVAIARDSREIIQAIKIPKTFVAYEWDFSWVVETSKGK
jgi:hypothetical protein